CARSRVNMRLHRKAAEPDSEALFMLSRVYGYLGQLTAEKVWQLQPDSYRSHELRGQSYENQKNYEAARAQYREALADQPKGAGPELRGRARVLGNEAAQPGDSGVGEGTRAEPLSPLGQLPGWAHLSSCRPTAPRKGSPLLTTGGRIQAGFRRGAKTMG